MSDHPNPNEAAAEDVPLVDVEHLQRVRLEPGDALALTLPDHPWSMEEIHRIREQVRAVFPGVQVLVLSPGSSLGAVNASPTDEPLPDTSS